MISDRSRQSGNVFIYILISIVLLGGLSFAISRSGNVDPTNEISTAAAKTAATSILAYESQARTAIDQMIQNGASVSNIDFSLPSVATFNSGSTTLKLFHPDGGGLQYKSLPAGAVDTSSNYTSSTFPSPGYYIGRFNNVEWTPTSAQDVIFSAFVISKKVCEALNTRIVGSPTPGSINFQRNFFISSVLGNGQFTNQDFTLAASSCSACQYKASFCTVNSSNIYSYYSILVAR